MSLCKWTDEDWDLLIYAIRKKKCILMLGPQTAIEEIDGESKLLSESLAELLARNIDEDTKKNIATSNLMEVAQYYCLKPNRGRLDLELKLKKFFEKRQALSSDFHRNLAALPFDLTINSSPDNMLFTALTEQNKKPEIGWYNFKRKRSYMKNLGTDREPLLFHLFGSVKEEESLVLTENDLLDFLVSIVAKNGLPNSLINELKDPEKSFLFLGFGFKHWYLRILLHILEVKGKTNRSFALEDFTPSSVDEYKSTVLFFRKGPCNIHFIEKKFDDFVEELRKRYEESPGTTTDVIPHVKEERPKVFICHANDDKASAADLYRQLKDAGLEPWLDKESLRGGDRWDDVIKKAIKKEIDYFLVLQSKTLQKKVEGYVNKEIYEARERQKSFRFGIRFIIPLKIDDCEILEELEDLQTMDISDEKKIGDLVRLIKRDYTKRGNK